MPVIHPREALFGADESAPSLPVCDHYCGVEVRMRKSLALQAELGPVFDITLDGEDGAPVGGEVEHAHLMAELINSAENRFGRVGARVQTVDHPAFEAMVDVLIGQAGARMAYLMLPKPRDRNDLERAVAIIEAAEARHNVQRPKDLPLPLHALVETHGALRDVYALAAHPRIESLSFGLMDFVSEHRGAIPQQAMTVQGQFSHPLVLRAKLEISAACHAYGKTPSHCVVTEFKNATALQDAARRAASELGYTRMWSIHPDQIRPIVAAFAPSTAEIQLAADILLAAQAAQWGPIRHRHGGQDQAQDQLHDRASYRYFWHVLERAHHTAMLNTSGLAQDVLNHFFPNP